MSRANLPEIVIDTITSDNALLHTLPADPHKIPREFKLHRIMISSFGFDRAAEFSALLTNPKPVGEIDSMGSFGPWDADEPGDTPVSGTFRFSDADFATLRGIEGIMSSEGSYKGTLNRLDVEGRTRTPDFALSVVDNPVPLHTHYFAVVDGTNGDTHLKSVRAQLGNSMIAASGKVVGVPGVKGRHILIEASSSEGHLEDMLRLAVKGQQPPMNGIVNLEAIVELLPGEGDMLNRLVISGRFQVREGRFTDEDVQEKLDALSRKGRGQPDDQGIQNVFSNLRGQFTMRKGNVAFSRLVFDVPGSEVNLLGSYSLRTEEVNFRGHLVLDAKLSQTTSGVRSFLLKIVDPFFSIDRGGSSVPIAITGSRSKPDFGLDFP
jgi:hypothetical protein